MSRAIRLPMSEAHELGAPSAFEVRWEPIASLAADPGPWRELVRRAIEPNVFLEPAFAGAAAAHLAGGEIHAITVRASERMLGLLPGTVEGMSAGRPVATFVAWTHAFAPLSTPLIDRSAAPDVVATMLEYLPRLPGQPKLALFPRIAEQGAAARMIAGYLGRARRAPGRLDPHERAALAPARGEGRAALSTGRSKELRRQRRRLADEGALSFEVVREPSRIRAALNEFLEVEASGWKSRAGTAAGQDPAASRFLLQSLEGLAAEGKSRLDLMRLDGRTIAAAITLHSGDQAWFWKTAFDERYGNLSPGVQLALELTDSLMSEQQLALVDSCAVHDHPMIDPLWSRRIAVADWLVPLGGPVAFAVGIAAEHARRAIGAPLRALRDHLRR